MKKRKVKAVRCRTLGACLIEHVDARIADELEKFAGILQGTLKNIEHRLAHLEEQLSRIEFGL
jgi:hypothetical protein